MDTFNFSAAAMIFVTYVAINVFYAVYVQAVAKQQPVSAAFFGSAICGLSAYGVVTYSHNVWYLVPLISGAFLGTYLAVEYKKD